VSRWTFSLLNSAVSESMFFPIVGWRAEGSPGGWIHLATFLLGISKIKDLCPRSSLSTTFPTSLKFDEYFSDVSLCGGRKGYLLRCYVDRRLCLLKVQAGSRYAWFCPPVRRNRSSYDSMSFASLAVAPKDHLLYELHDGLTFSLLNDRPQLY
jgi:hypothetical protein